MQPSVIGVKHVAFALELLTLPSGLAKVELAMSSMRSAEDIKESH